MGPSRARRPNTTANNGGESTAPPAPPQGVSGPVCAAWSAMPSRTWLTRRGAAAPCQRALTLPRGGGRSPPGGVHASGRHRPCADHLETPLKFVDTRAEGLDVTPAGDGELLERPGHSQLDEVLELGTPAADLAADQCRRGGQRPAHVLEERLAAVLHNLTPVVVTAPLLVAHDNLREHQWSQVATGVPVHHLDVVAITHQPRDAFQGYVAACPGVIELAICVLLDQMSICGH